MSEVHNHIPDSGKKLKISLVLNTSFMLFEFVAGILSGSLALISDAGHNLTDTLSIIISLFGNKVAQKEANPEHSYGYGRASILAALLNAFILIFLALYIFYEAAHRIFSHPHQVSGETIIVVALVGIVINGSIAFTLSMNKKDLNIRATYMNMLLDAVALVATLLAGLLITITHQSVIDPLASIFIGCMLIYGAFGVAREAVHVLLEGVPEGMNTMKVKETIISTPKVKAIDDIHVWAISSHYAALSCHIVIEDCDIAESMKIVQKIKQELKEKFHIEHATIETELTECKPQNM